MIRGTADAAVLDLAGVSVRLDGHALLSDVSLTVRRGALHVLVGPNGAGKSTLLAAILGQMPFEGRIRAHWRRNGRIGYVPQSFAIDRTLPMTVGDFLALTRQRLPVCFGITRAAARRTAAMLERVGLPGFERRLLSVLSGGELRRVLLAHSLEPSPELLILDEPSTGLDAASGRWLEETLLSVRARDEVSVLMASHDLDQVRRLADHVTALDRRVTSDGPPTEALP
jgi:zinc transport system ATP-binding protein